jgi:Mn2+/Fe2+ NRAMP family transporter
MEKCVYCGKKGEKLDRFKAVTQYYPICSEECKTKARDYVKLDKRFKMPLYFIIFACAITILISAIKGTMSQALYIAQIVFGVSMIVLPFPISSFETFKKCPIRTTKLITRLVGLVFVAAGSMLMLFA